MGTTPHVMVCTLSEAPPWVARSRAPVKCIKWVYQPRCARQNSRTGLRPRREFCRARFTIL
eukprot:1694786-Prymnesium_polylepis.1